ncbi:MAG TPA: amidohydrolase [Candidatus Coprenecus pullistercoris]|nr:amidohydrolase [Candidatus Coprenecus pullistercoris]
MSTILIKNVVVDGESRDIYIKNGTIRRIGVDICIDADTVLDGGGKTVMPAFVNMHTHSGMTLFRGICEDMPLKQWLDAVWKAETVLDDEFIYWGTRLACLEMIKTGTAAFADMYWSIDKAAEAVRDSGMRALLTYCFLDGGDSGKQRIQREECGRMYAISRDWPSRIQFGVSVHAHYTVSDGNMLWAADFARKHSLLIHTHISETCAENETHLARYGISPTARLHSMGLLGRDVIAAHTLWLSDEDVRMLGDSGTTVVHNVNSNLKLASGYRFRYNELRDAGANVTMGTDGAGSSNNLDLRESLKTAALVQKAWREDPAALPLDELLAMGTVNGAKALRLRSGVVEEGALADLILVDTDSPFFIPAHNFKANFIYAANSSCIDTLICDGRVLMRGGKVEGEDAVLSNAKEQASRFVERIKKL